MVPAGQVRLIAEGLLQKAFSERDVATVATCMAASLSKCLASLLKWLTEGLEWLSKQPNMA